MRRWLVTALTALVTALALMSVAPPAYADTTSGLIGCCVE